MQWSFSALEICDTMAGTVFTRCVSRTLLSGFRVRGAERHYWTALKRTTALTVNCYFYFSLITLFCYPVSTAVHVRLLLEVQEWPICLFRSKVSRVLLCAICPIALHQCRTKLSSVCFESVSTGAIMMLMSMNSVNFWIQMRQNPFKQPSSVTPPSGLRLFQVNWGWSSDLIFKASL